MNILIISQYFWPETFRVNDIARELAGRGHRVTVLTGRPNYPSGRLHEGFADNPEQYSEFHGVRIDRVPHILRGGSAFTLVMNYISFALLASMKAAWHYRYERFDACFVYEVSPITVALPAIVLRKMKKLKFTMWVLDLWPDTLEALGVVRSKRMLSAVARLVRFIYRNTDILLLQSRAFFERVEAVQGKAGRLEYLPSWSDVPDKPDTMDCAPEMQRFSGFRIVYTGNIGQAQDFPAILDAAEALGKDSDIDFIIVGDGRAADWVREQCERRRLSHVHLLGSFPLERMAAFYNSADALLLSLRPDPNFAMTIPAKLQGYLAAGKPVLAMLNGEGGRIVEEAGAGLICDAGDSMALSANVKRMIALPLADRKKMGEAGKRYGDLHFSRERLMDQIEQTLARLAAEGQSGSGSTLQKVSSVGR